MNNPFIKRDSFIPSRVRKDIVERWLNEIGRYIILGLQSISRDVADNVSHPRRLDLTMELIRYSFVLYLKHGRHDVKCKPSIIIIIGILYYHFA